MKCQIPQCRNGIFTSADVKFPVTTHLKTYKYCHFDIILRKIMLFKIIIKILFFIYMLKYLLKCSYINFLNGNVTYSKGNA